MDVSSVTVALPVSDLPAAVAWYRRLLEAGPPDLEPAPGVAEFKVGPVWLQLATSPAAPSPAAPSPAAPPASAATPAPSAPSATPGAAARRVVTRFGVANVHAEHKRLTGLGLGPGPVTHVPGVVDFFELHDPDGNALSFYTEAP